MSENKDEPVARRRRKILRHQREKTPEPSAKSGGVKPKYSDEESSSATERCIGDAHPPAELDKQSVPKAMVVRKSAHRSKILSRRDKAVGTAVVRSQSTPRNDSNVEMDVLPILRPPKPRSLSTPRHKDVAIEFNLVPPPSTLPIEKGLSVQDENKTLISEKSHTTDENQKLSQLEINLKKFEEERQRFEIEKERFEREKVEMRKIRFQRLEDFEKRRLNKKSKELELENNHEKLYKVCSVLERKSGITSTPTPPPTPPSSPSQHIIEVSNEKVTDTPKEVDPIMPGPMSNRNTTAKTIDTKKSNRDAKDSSTTKLTSNVDKKSRHADDLSDDYESSTALSSSSREGDFDDIDDDFIKQEIARSVHIDSFIDEPPPPSPTAVTKVVSRVKQEKSSALSKIPLIGRFFMVKPQQPIENKKKLDVDTEDYRTGTGRMSFIREARIVWRKLIDEHPDEWRKTLLVRNKCIADLIILSIFCGMGGIVFRFVEGAFESFYKCGVRRVKRDFVDNLWTGSHNLREEDWKTLARNKLRTFEEELHAAHEAGMTSYSGMKAWSFINGVNYCMTVVTTIGYGHISPSTNTGRAITMVYAIIGIPMFLILLADFGKLFTRGIKFLWAYVRRLYYTGSCRRVRRQAQVQEVIRGMNMAYEIATFRRPSLMVKDDEKGEDIEHHASESQKSTTGTTAVATASGTVDTVVFNPESPTTPPAETAEIIIDDEFNLPISLALFILIAYILCGATVYSMWEEWSFFESCYFVFISMSTIGFGDYVPKHPIYMMTSIIYLVFGLALTSMCINVVQLKLSDSFRQASAKIGATIGLSMAEEEARSQMASTESGGGTPNVQLSAGGKIDTLNGENNNARGIVDEQPPSPPPPLMPKKSQLLAAAAAQEANTSKTKSSKKDSSKKK